MGLHQPPLLGESGKHFSVGSATHADAPPPPKNVFLTRLGRMAMVDPFRHPGAGDPAEKYFPNSPGRGVGVVTHHGVGPMAKNTDRASFWEVDVDKVRFLATKGCRLFGGGGDPLRRGQKC